MVNLLDYDVVEVEFRYRHPGDNADSFSSVRAIFPMGTQARDVLVRFHKGGGFVRLSRENQIVGKTQILHSGASYEIIGSHLVKEEICSFLESVRGCEIISSSR